MWRKPKGIISFKRLYTDLLDFCRDNKLHVPVYIEDWYEANTDLSTNPVYIISQDGRPIGLMQAWSEFNNACLTINPIEISEDLCSKGLGTKVIKTLLSGKTIFGTIHYISADATPTSLMFWTKLGARFSSEGSYTFTLSI